jgi:hypothetical protein
MNEIPESLTVRIDMTPHPYLMPNMGKHKRTREPYKDALKEAAAAGAQNILIGRTWSYDGPIMLVVSIFWEKSRRVVDWDNAVASIKSAIDGVFIKLNADDRQIVGIMLRQKRDRTGHGYMTMTIDPYTPEKQAA